MAIRRPPNFNIQMVLNEDVPDTYGLEEAEMVYKMLLLLTPEQY